MANKVIEAFKAAQNKRRRIRNIFLIALLLEIVAFGFAFYLTFQSFADYGIPALSSALQKKATPVVERLAYDFPKIASRVVPVYVSNFESAFEKGLPEIQKVMLAELAKLELYGEKQSPYIEKELHAFADAQDQAFIEELRVILGPKADAAMLDRLALDYRIALDKKFSEFMVSGIGAHVQVAETIKAYAEQLAAKPGISSEKIDSQAVLGIGLELLGKDLQEIK